MVYTSTLPRSIQTVTPLLNKTAVVGFEQQSSLNMLDTGACHGMTVEQIREKMPIELEKWAKDKYRYRFPGGESQQDLALALEPFILELERQTLPVLVVSHSSTLQVLYGYFLGTSCSVNQYYALDIPRHTVIELTPNQYGWQEKRYNLSDSGLNASKKDTPAVPPSPAPVLHGVSFYRD
jgi:broad specificity phosphatase PhoE